MVNNAKNNKPNLFEIVNNSTKFIGKAAIIGLIAYTGYQITNEIIKNKEATEINLEQISSINNKLYHYPSNELAIENNNANLIDKLNAYEHNSNIIIEAAKRFSKEYATLPGKYRDSNILLEESITQIYAESKLQQTWLNGNIMKSKKNAKGAGQFLPIAIEDLNMKLIKYQNKNQTNKPIQPINKALALSATHKGAQENVRANILHKKLSLERLGNSKAVNAEYHQGGKNIRKAKKRANSNDPNKYLKRIGPEGKKYIKEIENHKTVYKTIDQFSKYAKTNMATNLINQNLNKAREIKSNHAKIDLYEEIHEFSEKLKEDGIFNHKKQLRKATYELAILYQTNNPSKAYELATSLIHETKNSNKKNDKFYFKNATYIVNKLYNQNTKN